MNYEQIAARQAAYTGGIGCWPLFSTSATSGAGGVWSMRFRLKTLDSQIKPALDLLHDLLFEVDPQDKNRLLDILRQTRAKHRTDMVNNGSKTARTHAGRGLTPEGYLGHLVQGLGQLELSEQLIGKFDKSSDELIQRIETIRAFMLNRRRVAVSFTGSDESANAVRSALGAWVGVMHDEAVASGGVEFPAYPGAPMGSGSYAALMEEAQKHLGKPYVFGAKGPDKFDCSGFVCWSLSKSGVRNIATNAQGLYNASTPVSRENAQPGDLIFFKGTYSTHNTVTHVGIYIGNGQMIHAGKPVQYASIDTRYWTEHFYSFGRIN